MYLRFIILLILLVFSVGCFGPKIDTSTEESLKLSSQNVRQSLPESQREAFDNALQVLLNANAQSKLRSDIPRIQELERIKRTDLNGITAKEIFHEAAKVSEISEIITLEKRMQAQEVASEELKKVEILFYDLREFKPSYDFSLSNPNSVEELEKLGVDYSEFTVYYAGESIPVFDVTLKNGTAFPIYNVNLDVTIDTSKEALIFFDDRLFYPIKNGLEPGETKNITWTVGTSAWFNNPLDAMSDESVSFFVQVAAILGGENGDTWFKKAEIEKEDKERLLALKRKYKIE